MASHTLRDCGIPTPRHAAQFDLTRMVMESGAATTGETVDDLMSRLLRAAHLIMSTPEYPIV